MHTNLNFNELLANLEYKGAQKGLDGEIVYHCWNINGGPAHGATIAFPPNISDDEKLTILKEVTRRDYSRDAAELANVKDCLKRGIPVPCIYNHLLKGD